MRITAEENIEPDFEKVEAPLEEEPILAPGNNEEQPEEPHINMVELRDGLVEILKNPIVMSWAKGLTEDLLEAGGHFETFGRWVATFTEAETT